MRRWFREWLGEYGELLLVLLFMAVLAAVVALITVFQRML